MAFRPSRSSRWSWLSLVLLVLVMGGRALAQAPGAAAAPARPTWLTLLTLLATAAMVAGVVALVGFRRGRTTGPAAQVDDGWSKHRRTGGVVLVAAGALAHLLLSKWHPPVRETITERVFSSGRMPAIDLDLPPGWRLTHGQAEGVPDVVTATSTSPASPSTDAAPGSGAAGAVVATLVVQSSLLDGPVDVARLGREITTGMEKAGAKVAPPSEAQLDGRVAMIVAATRTDGTNVTVWIVRRADRFVSQVYCFGPAGDRAACAPALAHLRWHAPGPL